MRENEAMTPRWLSLGSLAVAIPALASCVYYEHKETVNSPLYVYSNMPECPVRQLALATPTVALFLGVSGYGPNAGVFSTPAHLIGANLFAGLFGRAGDEAGPGMYSGTTISDVLPSSKLPEGGTDPMNVVRVMGYGGGGTGEQVGRARIQRALADAIVAADKTHERQGRVQLVIYVAAHGFLGPDGQPYFLPADAVADDPATWISYRAVVESVKEFLSRNPEGSLTRTALVIFDTCQNRRGGAPLTAAKLPAVPGLTLVQSAAPGQYAWHWTGRNTITNQQPGFGLDPLHEPGFKMREITATMSVLPLANQCSLSDTLKARNPQPGGADQAIGVREWFSAVRTKADGYLAQVPEMKQLGRTQEISIAVADTEATRPLFIVKAANATGEKGR